MKIDHLVYAVPDLNQAIADLDAKLGIAPVFGGQHLTKGTKNALLNLGNGAYLELLAIDSTNDQIQPPRWMGIDLIEAPQMVRWALKTDQIDLVSSLLSDFHPEHGRIETGERQQANGEFLRWQMCLPTPIPVVDILPFFVDWSSSLHHPCNQLETGCSLQGLQLFHPQPPSIAPLFRALNISLTIRKGPQSIRIQIAGPKGSLSL
ncbi:MAG: VOC family protein [Bacteroidota bacterium]